MSDKNQKILLYSESSTSAAGITKNGIAVQKLTRLQAIIVEVTGTVTAGTISTYRLGGILNALISAFSLTSSNYGNLVTSAKGSDLAIVASNRPNGKNNYAKFGTSAATAAIVNHTTNYNPTAWVNTTSYYLEGSFEWSLSKVLPGQPDNLCYIDTQRDSLTIDLSCMDKLGSLFLTSLGGAAVTNTTVKVYGVYTDEPDYNSQIRTFAIFAKGNETQPVEGNFYEYPALKNQYLAAGFSLISEDTIYPNPEYRIGKVRTLRQKSQANASSGSTSITVIEDNTPRDYEALIFTGQNNATPFAPATGSTITELLVKLTDKDTEFNLVKESAEDMQHDAFRVTDEIDMTGVYPLIFAGKPFGNEHGFNAQGITKVVCDQATTAAVDISSILVGLEHQDK